METGAPQLDRVIETLQRMDTDHRREVMQSPEMQRYFQKLTPADGKRLLMATLDRGIAQQMERYHKMSKAERAQFIEEGKAAPAGRARAHHENVHEERDKRRAMLLSDANFEEMFEKAMKSYLSVTTSEERAVVLAPLFEARCRTQLIRGRYGSQEVRRGASHHHRRCRSLPCAFPHRVDLFFPGS